MTTQPNEFYTAQVLSVVCPVCKGVNRCLEPNLYGHKFIDQPHKERVELAERSQLKSFDLGVGGFGQPTN